MRDASWQARIECGGLVAGAGFLVTPSTVLTCAHVVQDSEPDTLTVSFPNRPDLPALPATVAVHGGWAGGTADPGDLAVLELAGEVPLRPARFAPPDAWHRPAEWVVEAYGFPAGYEEGQLARYRAVSTTRVAGQWVQLEAVTAHGQPLTEGFSGAAAALPDGRVVGMIAQRAGEPGVLVARMLPTETLARHWPGLGALVPARDDGEDPTPRLYELVRRAEATGLACSPDQLFVDAVGPFGPELPPGGFPSLRAAVGYVQWEVVPAAEALARLGDRLAELLDGPATGPARTAPSGDRAPILVEIDHSGAGTDQVTVSVSAYRDGRRRPVGTARLARDEVREYVQRGIDRAFTHLAPDAEELLAFVLPRDLLNLPVAHWACSTDDPTPLGCAHPVVVNDRYRHHSGRLRHKLGKKWRKLSTGSGTPLHRVDCGTPEHPPGLRRRLGEQDAALVGFAAPPEGLPEHFAVGLTLPVPVLVWPRSGCPGPAGHPEPCPGTAFLDALAPCVEGVPAAELPRHIQALREEAEAAEEPGRHWARDVQLLWDDPRCFPEPPASLHSPVT
ncbi:trypsin-like peptidase domain-containing protein [Streptomyces sp. NRRL S-1022]|uniref:VMAP-C domain-containing protein n=1 Tax=Streptomyces sp. NRRL S-1022 TaxID=1463880 RepID=UPI0004BFE7E0|nr:trypsin-like peptidase domain-containing protein [Streptomyces sp. NRRL S-1022]